MGKSSRKEKQYKFHKYVVDGAKPEPPPRLAKIRKKLSWGACESRSEKIEVLMNVSCKLFYCVKKVFIPKMDLGDASQIHWMDRAYSCGALCEICSRTTTQRTISPAQMRVMRHYLHSGASPNECNTELKKNISCLHYVASGGHCKLAEMLLAFGANPDVKNFAWDTPLSIAVGRGHGDLVKVLLDSGANPSTLDRAGHSPLYYACIALDLGMVRLLLARGASTLLHGEATPPIDLCKGAKGVKGAKGSISAAGAQKLQAVIYPAWVNEKHGREMRKTTQAAAAKEQKVQDFLARRSAMSTEEKKAEHRTKKAALKRLEEQEAAEAAVAAEAIKYKADVAKFLANEGEKRRAHLIAVGIKVGEGAWHRRVSDTDEVVKWEWDPGFAEVEPNTVDPGVHRAQEENKQENRKLIDALRGQPKPRGAQEKTKKMGTPKPKRRGLRGWHGKKIVPDGSQGVAEDALRDSDDADDNGCQWQSTADDERWHAASASMSFDPPERGHYAPPPNSETAAVAEAPDWAEMARWQNDKGEML